MIKSFTALLLSNFILAGSIILPLGDFSLMKDLPGMYRSYCSIRAGEPALIDFVGDYLLGGKDLLGHNQHDAPVKSDGSPQFQHQANVSLFFAVAIYRLSFLSNEPEVKHPVYRHLFHTSDYQNELFRPPLA
ncbi:hypothetical protein BH09BAC6_BH09BAC6_24160 [soil metagenome]